MVDYEYYVNCYLGEEIPEKAFSRLAKRADSYLKKMKKMWLVEGGEDACAMAICAMAELLLRVEKSKNVASATLGGVSVMYQPMGKGELLEYLYNEAISYLDIYRGSYCYDPY
jgi:hypothetical protein